MNALSDQELWSSKVTASGTVSDSSAIVWVNGVQGTNYGDGTWIATNVPVPVGASSDGPGTIVVGDVAAMALMLADVDREPVRVERAVIARPF